MPERRKTGPQLKGKNHNSNDQQLRGQRRDYRRGVGGVPFHHFRRIEIMGGGDWKRGAFKKKGYAGSSRLS